MKNFAWFPEYVICFNSLLRPAVRVCVDFALKKGSGSGGLVRWRGAEAWSPEAQRLRSNSQ